MTLGSWQTADSNDQGVMIVLFGFGIANHNLGNL